LISENRSDFARNRHPNGRGGKMLEGDTPTVLSFGVGGSLSGPA
jgi:hypothetical protein